MPWQELLPVNLRMHFVTDWETGCWTMSELCADYQISRKTGYKWLARHETSGPGGLHDRSSRPHQSPAAADAALVAATVAMPLKHPRWGAKNLLAVARRQDSDAAWPSRSTV